MGQERGPIRHSVRLETQRFHLTSIPLSLRYVKAPLAADRRGWTFLSGQVPGVGDMCDFQGGQQERPPEMAKALCKSPNREVVLVSRHAHQPLTRLIAVVTLIVAVLAGALVPSTSADAKRGATARWNRGDVRVSNPKTLFKGEQKGLYEPSIAIDPTNPRNMIAFAIDLSGQNVNPDIWSVTRAFRSTNGGRTWADRGPVRYTRKGNDITQSGDPVAVFDSEGNAYYASLASPPKRPGGIYVHRSRNGGASWRLPVLAVPELEDTEGDSCPRTDKEWLSVDPRTGRLYLAYTLFTFTCSESGAPTDLYTRLTDIGVYLTSSDDKGATWRKPREIWQGYALGAIPKVGPDGTLYVAFWGTVEAPPTACPTAAGVLTAKGGGRPFVSIITGNSTDGGKRWSFHRQPICDFIAGEIVKPGRFVGGSFFPSLAVDQSNGTAYIAYPSFVSEGRFTIELITSNDRGASWSHPVELTAGPNDARMPAVFADAGVVRLVYVETTGFKDQDDQTADGTAKTLYMESADGGATWSEPAPLSTKIGRPKEFTELGDYLAIDVAAGRIATTWTDARKGAEAGEIWSRVGSVTTPASVEQTSKNQRGPFAPSTSPLMVGIGSVPRDAQRHRNLETSWLPIVVDRDCAPPSERVRLTKALREAASTSFHSSCPVRNVFRYASQIANRLKYRALFSDYEGFEAELLLARGEEILLLKVTDSNVPEDSSEVMIKKL